MAMRLADGWAAGGTIGSWRLPGEPAFAKSRAYELLSRDLRRYVQEEVPGRSFLIAGHRGAGKTTTVVRAVQRLRSELLLLSANPDNAAFGRRGRLQRPLLVKLVGHSLIAPPPLRAGESEKRGGGADKGGDGADAGGRNSQGDPANAETRESNSFAAEKPVDQVESALVHITIALYRALAGEIAQAFVIHAAASRERDRRELMELGAQLALDLDGTPDAALLRCYWDKLGRLGRGVLWPPRTDQTFRRRSIADQGLREIVALAAAGQAFQVCSGEVTDSVTNKDTATNDQAVEARVDVKDLVNRLGAMGAGTLAGSVIGTSQGAVPGVGIGLLVWMLSGLVLTWTSSRTRKRSRTLDYTFLKDRTIQTLDRDLPLVIERIREAGLAPVFVIDELDKLPNPGKTIALIINRIKHLVADYGFFCFLTDRGYFDEIEQKVAKQAYPTEHTYFSQRVLVINRPQDLFGYLVGLLDPKAEATGAQAFANDVFALSVIFRSKLNFSDVARETARLTGERDELTCSEEDLRRPGEFRLAATIQLAINQVLLDENVADRFESDSVFAQLAIDALYYIPRRWEMEIDADVDIRLPTIRADLIERMRSRTPDGPGAQAVDGGGANGAASAGEAGRSATDDEPHIAKADMIQLAGLVSRMAGYLRDFRRLATAVVEREAGVPRLAPIVVVEKEGLLAPLTPRSTVRFRFTLDELANPRNVGDAAAQPDEDAPDEKDVLRAEQALIEAIAGLLKTAGVSIDQLVASRVLPVSLTDGLLRTTLDDLNLAVLDLDLPPRARKQKQARENGHNGWLAFTGALGDYGERLALALVLVAQVRKEGKDGGVADAPAVVLAKIARYFGAEPGPMQIGGDWTPALTDRMRGGTGSVVSFTRRYAAYLKREIVPRIVTDDEIAKRWDAWRDHLEGYLCRRQPGTISPDYLDLLLAAQDKGPGRLFRANADEMDLVDWSEAALAPLPAENKKDDAPFWLTMAALIALKFDGPTRVRIWRGADSLTGVRLKAEDGPAMEQFASAAVANAAELRPGLLHIYADEVPVKRPAEIPRSRPLLSVRYSLLKDEVPGLNWLAERGVIDGGIDEVGTTGSRPPLWGMLAKFDWVTVTRESTSQAAIASEDVSHDIRSSERLIEAYGRRQRGGGKTA